MLLIKCTPESLVFQSNITKTYRKVSTETNLIKPQQQRKFPSNLNTCGAGLSNLQRSKILQGCFTFFIFKTKNPTLLFPVKPTKSPVKLCFYDLPTFRAWFFNSAKECRLGDRTASWPTVDPVWYCRRSRQQTLIRFCWEQNFDIVSVTKPFVYCILYTYPFLPAISNPIVLLQSITQN